MKLSIKKLKEMIKEELEEAMAMPTDAIQAKQSGPIIIFSDGRMTLDVEINGEDWTLEAQVGKDDMMELGLAQGGGPYRTGASSYQTDDPFSEAKETKKEK